MGDAFGNLGRAFDFGLVDDDDDGDWRVRCSKGVVLVLGDVGDGFWTINLGGVKDDETGGDSGEAAGLRLWEDS